MNEQEKYYIKNSPIINSTNKASLFRKYLMNMPKFDEFIKDISENNYLYWDKVKYRKPVEGYTVEESWQVSRWVRTIKSVKMPVKTVSGEYFYSYRTQKVDSLLRTFDMKAGGNMIGHKIQLSDSEKNRFMIRGIMEESISSSELEGADTSSKYAKKMLAENIKPRNASEQMILNHYKTLRKIDRDYKNREMSRELLLEIQEILTENAIEEPNQSGRFRADKDEIVVQYKQKISHIPPNEKFLNEQIDEMIQYANNTEDSVHPLVKAIVLHFWIGYLHPFCDGNGRTARSIFYWYLLRNDYWAILYLPISSTLKNAKDQYAMSYIYAEQDQNDFTYFFEFITKKILQAISEFDLYIDRKVLENKYLSSKVKNLNLNPRQQQVVGLLLKDPSNKVTGKSHSIMSSVSLKTAYRDLKELEKLKIVSTSRSGKNVDYYISEKFRL
ncbi:Fic family protein [Candidatus Saccharibacteria bacterium]|nr:Fic family protein [Candidatus Saccharibacteria bacterium]